MPKEAGKLKALPLVMWQERTGWALEPSLPDSETKVLRLNFTIMIAAIY